MLECVGGNEVIEACGGEGQTHGVGLYVEVDGHFGEVLDVSVEIEGVFAWRLWIDAGSDLATESAAIAANDGFGVVAVEVEGLWPEHPLDGIF